MELERLPLARERPLLDRGVRPPREEGVLGHSCSWALSVRACRSASLIEDPVTVLCRPLPTGSWRRREGGFCSVTYTFREAQFILRTELRSYRQSLGAVLRADLLAT